MGNKNNLRSMKNALKVLSNALVGGGVSLDLTSGGNACAYEDYTANDVVVKHVLIPNADFSIRENCEIAEGQAVHESLHCIYTNFKALNVLTKDRWRDLRKGIFNSIEDAYIEAFGSERWPGLRLILNRRLVHFIRKGWIMKAADAEGIVLIDRYIYMYLTVKRNNAPLHEILNEYEVKIRQQLGDSNVDELTVLIDKATYANDSFQGAYCANDIVDLIISNLKTEEPTPDESQDDGDSSDDDGNSDESQDGDSSDGDSSDSDSKSDENQSDGDSSNGDGKKTSKSGENQKDDDKPFTKEDLKELLYSKCNYSSKELQTSDKAFEMLAQSASQQPDMSVCSIKKFEQNYGKYEYKSLAKSLQSRIIRPLQASLQAQTWKRESFSNKGELDTSRLIRALTDGKAMRQETIKKGENSAISLLVDMSQSMFDVDERYSTLTRAEIAELSMFSMMNALEQLKVPAEAYCYKGKFGPEGHCGVAAAYKLFHEKASVIGGRLGRAPAGSTPTGPAMVTAIASLSKRAEPKKILYVITDGMADNEEEVLQAYDMTRLLGIQVRFICIGLCWPYEFGQEHALKIENVSDLPKILRNLAVRDI